MRIVRTCLFALLVSAAAGLWIHEVAAQPAGLNPGRDCQVIRTCNFSRGGSYRGCLSSYSCRICRFVRTSCYQDPGRRVCQELRCAWG